METSAKRNSALELSIVLLALATATAISFYSGYRTIEVPLDLAWQFSPIGFLQGVSPENLELRSEGFFQGAWGFTPDYLFVFLKTCLFELPFYRLCFRQKSWAATLAILVLANLLTHPFVFFLIPLFFERYVSAALTSEAFAPGVEMVVAYFILTRTRPKLTPGRAALRALLILLANLVSWEVGSFL